jgi:hypothetical protein
MAKNSYKKGQISYPFVPIPKAVLTGPEWQKLPHSARALALDLAAQYTGRNNGRLTAAFEAMRRVGWTSKGTLQRAKVALQDATFVMLTRKGHAPRTAEWFGFTWWRLDYESSMDVDPRLFPYLNFMMGAPRLDPNVGRASASGPRFVMSKNRTDASRNCPPGGAESGPIDRDESPASVLLLDHVS